MDSILGICYAFAVDRGYHTNNVRGAVVSCQHVFERAQHGKFSQQLQKNVFILQLIARAQVTATT